MASVREYAVLYVRPKGPGGGTAGGGNVLLAAGVHALDGGEHSGRLEADRVSYDPTASGLAATDVQDAIDEVAAGGGGGGGAPTAADYLVGTAQAGLSAEIVVGTTPGGELGGTWASPTVDATHSGSAHLALGSTSSTAAAGDHTHAGGGALDDLTDVDAPSPVDGDLLAWDDGTGAWVNVGPAFVPTSVISAKGDIVVGTAATTVGVRSVGTDGYALVADSGHASGLGWLPVSGGGGGIGSADDSENQIVAVEVFV